RLAGWAIVVPELVEARLGHERAPSLEVPVAAVALSLPAFAVVTARVGAEEDPARFERGPELLQDPRQLGARHVEERRVGEDAVEAIRGQRQGDEVLLEHLAA